MADRSLTCELCHISFPSPSAKRSHLLSPSHQARQAGILPTNHHCSISNHGIPFRDLLFPPTPTNASKPNINADLICYQCRAVFSSEFRRAEHCNICHKKEGYLEDGKKWECQIQTRGCQPQCPSTAYCTVCDMSGFEPTSSWVTINKKCQWKYEHMWEKHLSSPEHLKKLVEVQSEDKGALSAPSNIGAETEAKKIVMTPREMIESAWRQKRWCAKCSTEYGREGYNAHKHTDKHISTLESCRNCQKHFETWTGLTTHTCLKNVPAAPEKLPCTRVMAQRNKIGFRNEKEWLLASELDTLKKRKVLRGERCRKGPKLWCGVCEKEIMKDFSLSHVDPYQTPEEFVKDHEKGYEHRCKAGVTCGTVGHRRKRYQNEHCWRCDLPFW
ncbi:hypothetical protein FPQ18DRAFT_320416 [Pyronema domesticum]|nr:hypothetical protein FPQ18DRAFT_320416 [Pyronema domesticum]